MSLVASAMCAGAAGIKATAALDSAFLLMGKQTPLHVEVMGELNESGALEVIDSMWKEIEIIDMGKPTVTDLGNNRKQLVQDIIIQSFDSGMYAVPPVIYIQPGETIATNSLVLKVVPVPIDTLVTVHDYADVANVDREFFDYLPDWATDYGIWILLAIIVIGGCLFVYFKWLRKGKLPSILKPKPEPPYVVAVRRLNKLNGENLCERGEETQFYTRLTDILRTYLDGRFGINAMEMTSSQILEALRHNSDTRDSEQLMQRVLEIADFVKFAKVRPLPDDNTLAMRSAMKFVEDTKPVENPQPTQNTQPKDSEK
ncbi:MAG: cell wall anchor protein [Bacteroides sp.]|nr:cell wall anchor protein [Bacteroides sp.]